MNLQDAKTKTSTTKEEDNSEYYLAAAYGSAPDAKNLPKSESRHQLGNVNSPTGCSEAASSPDGSLQNLFTSQHNDIPLFPPSQIFGHPAILSTDSNMFVPPAMELESSQLKLLLTADQLPPVTKRTLSELDLDRIMRNINLRVDVNFDHGLHFMPVDGGRARDKRQYAASYYEALGIEMSIYAFYAARDAVNGTAGDGHSSPLPVAFEPRLPDMLKTLQDVLKTLVPERDHFCVMENLDVSFLMQQIRKGVLDLVGLSQWLGALLKTHCAPMRDPLVDKMATEIRDGCAAPDMQQVAQGLKTMFGALEAMKLVSLSIYNVPVADNLLFSNVRFTDRISYLLFHLFQDVANHQIRAFRIVLVEDTVRFLQNHFLGRITTNTINVERARRWYLSLSHQDVCNPSSQSQTDSLEPVRTLFRGLLPILLSYDRPKGFPDTFQFDVGRLLRLRADVQNIICLEICYHIFRELATNRNRHVSIQTQEYLSLRAGIWSVLDVPTTGATECCRWQNNISGVALEIARAISSREIKAAENNGGDDCRSRATNLDGNIIQVIEKILESSFTRQSPRFRHFQTRLRFRLETATFQLAKKYLCMSPLEMCEAQRQRNTRAHSADLESVAKRFAHIGVLHWKVWAPLLYAREGSSTLAPEPPLLHENNDNRTSTET